MVGIDSVRMAMFLKVLNEHLECAVACRNAFLQMDEKVPIIAGEDCGNHECEIAIMSGSLYGLRSS